MEADVAKDVGSIQDSGSAAIKNERRGETFNQKGQERRRPSFVSSRQFAPQSTVGAIVVPTTKTKRGFVQA
jgi:hypothetical protein